MTDTSFGEATRRWCPLAAQMLGWRPNQFWAATPSELALALSDPTGERRTDPPSRNLIKQMMERDRDG